MSKAVIPSDISVDTACEILDSLCCSQDPIWRGDEWTSPDGICNNEGTSGTPAKEFRCCWYRSKGERTEFVSGNLFQMMLERMGAKYGGVRRVAEPGVKF